MLVYWLLMNNDWGEAVNPDGSRVPLVAPLFSIPEDEREVVIDTPRLVLWTRRP